MCNLQVLASECFQKIKYLGGKRELALRLKMILRKTQQYAQIAPHIMKNNTPILGWSTSGQVCQGVDYIHKDGEFWISFTEILLVPKQRVWRNDKIMKINIWLLIFSEHRLVLWKRWSGNVQSLGDICGRWDLLLMPGGLCLNQWHNYPVSGSYEIAREYEENCYLN